MNQKRQSINGYARWIMVAIALATIAYNGIATHILAKNEIKHLRQDIARIEAKVEQLYLLQMKKD